MEAFFQFFLFCCQFFFFDFLIYIYSFFHAFFILWNSRVLVFFCCDGLSLEKAKKKSTINLVLFSECFVLVN